MAVVEPTGSERWLASLHPAGFVPIAGFGQWQPLVMLIESPGQRVPSQDIAFSQLLNEVDQGHVREVTIAGNEITGHFTDNRAFATYAPNDPTLVQSLYKKNVSITARPPSENTNWLMTLLVNGLPLIAIIGIWIFLSRRMQGGAGTAMGLASPRQSS